MRGRRRVLFSLFLAASLAGCSLFGHRDKEAKLPSVLFSPNGEPLTGGPLGQPSCHEAMSRWFDRVDTNHDGAIDLKEYRADARRQFGVMDLDHSGVITPDELSRYRYPYAAPLAAAAEKAAQAAARKSRYQNDEIRVLPSGSDMPDPVMAADVDLRNQVTLPEFLAYASREFASLDKAGHGRLSRTDVLSLCKSAS